MQVKYITVLATFIVASVAVPATRNLSIQSRSQWEYAVYHAGEHEWIESDRFVHSPSFLEFLADMGLEKRHPTASYPRTRLEAQLVNYIADQGWELFFIENRTGAPAKRSFWFKRKK